MAILTHQGDHKVINIKLNFGNKRHQFHTLADIRPFLILTSTDPIDILLLSKILAVYNTRM
jgi:hypothetical protein